MTVTLRASLIADMGINTVKGSDDVVADGYVDSKKAGVFASLNAAATTTITLAETFQKINGVFTNSPMEGFVLDVDKLKATLTKAKWMKISWSCSFSCNVTGTTVHIGMAKNAAVLTVTGPSAMGAFAKYGNEAENMAGEDVVLVDTDDTIQIQVTTDGTDDEVTFNHFQATIAPMFK